MFIALIAVSAITPSLLILWFFHARDVYREPARVLWATFGLGVLTIPAVLLAVWPVVAFSGLDRISNPYAAGLADAFITAAIPEELFKFSVLYLYAQRHREFDEPMDGVVYGVAAALGFATLENILYVSSGGVGVAVMRAVTAVPCHAFAGAIMGYYVGQAKFRPQERGKLLAIALAAPIILHGLYDFPLLTLKNMGEREPPVSPGAAITGALIATWLVTLIVEAVWALRGASKLRREQLAVERGHQLAAAQAAGQPPPPDKAPSKVKGWLMVVVGFVFAAGGGLITLGLTLGLALADNEKEDIAPLVGVLVVLGIGPLVVGGLLFGFGIRTLNRRFAHDRAVALAPATQLQAAQRGPLPGWS